MASKSLDGVLVKKANKGQSFTEEQLDEFVKCADQETGPTHFLENFFYIQHPVKGKMLYQPYTFQKGLVDNYHNFRFSINLLSRQMGKTTTAAGYLLWYAMFVPDSVILILRHTNIQALKKLCNVYVMVMNFVLIILEQELQTTTKVQLNLKTVVEL